MLRRIFKAIFGPEDTTKLRDRIDDLEKSMRRLEEEWTEVYHKFRTMQLRIAKQVQRLDENSSQEEPQGAGGDETPSEQIGVGSSLSPRQQKLQREIIARRQRQSAQGGE